jgi:hypothetical protein
LSTQDPWAISCGHSLLFLFSWAPALQKSHYLLHTLNHLTFVISDAHFRLPQSFWGLNFSSPTQCKNNHTKNKHPVNLLAFQTPPWWDQSWWNTDWSFW